jgi:hypothetical protein
MMIAVAALHCGVTSFLRMVMIAVNRTLIASAASAGDCHDRGARNWRVHERERKEAE